MSRFASLIYGAIVAMWAMVLLPMWARRHRKAMRDRSAEGFTQAMRVLARRHEQAQRVLRQRQRQGQRPAIATPARCAAPGKVVRAPQRQVDQSSATPAVDSRKGQIPMRPGDHVVAWQARRAARVRRRRVLTVLVAATAVTGLAAWLTPLTVHALVVPLTLLGPYVVFMRGVVAREHAQQGWTRKPKPEVDLLPDNSGVVSVWHGDQREEMAEQPQQPARPIVTLDTPLFDAQADPSAAPAATPGPHWEPRETLLPTYVQKNVLHRRRIVLGGSWTDDGANASASADTSEVLVKQARVRENSEALEGQLILDLRPRDQASTADATSDQFDEMEIEHPRAVND